VQEDPGDLGMTRHSDSGVAIKRRIQKAAGPFAVLRCVAIEQHRRVETIDFGYFEAMGKGLSLPHRDLKILGLRSRGHKAQHLRARDFSPDSQNRAVRRRRQDLPGSWRTLYERAMLSDPGGTSVLGHCRTSVLSSAKWTASTPTTNTNFGAQSHGPHTRCLRFAGWITPPPRKTRFRRLASLTGRDSLPAGS
jgi:hypothetical protein